jgi:NAD(P)H-hydrate repair Nnr-like enzyme with NAD(P)H-hydrate dehydratase domain
MVDEWLEKIMKWEKAIYSWVIGPGLGRDKYMNEFFPKLVKKLPSHSVVVFDADGIYYLCQHPELFEELSRLKAIITPNKKELQMIEKALKIEIEPTVKKITAIEGQVTEF